MPSIPLPQFPAEFNARCFKCNSNSLHFNFTKHPWMWTKLEIQYSCRMCGMTGYGEDNVVAKFSPQLESWRREQQRAAWEEQMFRERVQREADETAAREAQEAATAAARAAQIMAQKSDEYQLRVNEALERRRIQTLENKRRRDREYRERKKLKANMAALSEEMRLAEERTAEVRARREEDEERAAAAASTKCAWRDCEHPRTEASKYCSRTCSNRNAAWNLRQRKGEALSC